MFKENCASRRSILGTFGTGLFGLQAKNFQSATRKKRIVVARDEHGPVEVESVSKKWWNHRNHAHDVKDNMVERYRGVEGFVGAGLGTTQNTVGERREFKVDLKVENSNVNLQVPSSIEGTQIDTKVTAPSARLGCYNDGPYSTLKGGVICQEETDTANYATTGPMVKRNGTRYLLNCWHMFDNNDDHYCATVDGDPFYHQGSYFGSVVDAYHLNDWAIVDVDSSNMTDGILTSHDNSIHKISAWFTETGIDNAHGEGRQFHRQGVTSGLMDGYIGNTNVDNIGPEGCINSDYCITYDIDSASGDSGGPIFAWGKDDPDKAVLAGWVSWGEGPIYTMDGCTTDDLNVYEQTYGPLMDTIYDQYGISPVTG
jgi:hypothetical protein